MNPEVLIAGGSINFNAIQAFLIISSASLPEFRCYRCINEQNSLVQSGKQIHSPNKNFAQRIDRKLLENDTKKPKHALKAKQIVALEIQIKEEFTAINLTA